MNNRKVKFRKSEATEAIQNFLDKLQEDIHEIEAQAKEKKAELDALRTQRAALVTTRDTAIEQFTESEEEEVDESLV